MQTFDATDQSLGRLATQIARVLSGKNNTAFTPNIITGDTVTVYNAAKIKVTGKKNTDKKYYHHSGYLGNLKTTTFDQAMAKDPRWVIRHAVAGMLPKNRLRKEMLKRLNIVKGQIDANN